MGVGESTDEILDDGGEWWFKEFMQATLIALFFALLLVGCGSPNVDDPETLDKIIAEAVDEDKLQMRGKKGEVLLYSPNEQMPFTGWVKSIWENGQVKYLIQYKGGEPEGLTIEWYDNGQMKYKTNHKDRKPNGLTTFWDENGKKKSELNYKDGVLVD